MERFEEDLGTNTYIDLPQVKDYLSISSTTQDARLANIISYATGVVEHYIGQELLANDYVEIFDGGKASVFTSRLPLNNVYQVTEFNGSEHQILNDSTTIGTPVVTSGSDGIAFTVVGNGQLTTRIKKFGTSSLELNSSDYVVANSVPDNLKMYEGDFTIEAFVRVDETTLQDNVVFAINTDASNYMQFRTANQYGLAFESNVAGTPTVVQGANTSIEAQQFSKRKWAHIAVSRKLDDEKLYMHYNGNVIADASYSEAELTFTSNVQIGTTFKGYIDDLRVTNKAMYGSSDFTAPSNKFRPDDDTVLLLHFDGKQGSTSIIDVHAAINDYTFSRDHGEIIRETNSSATVKGGVQRTWPSMTLAGPAIFQGYPSGVRVSYNAGYQNNTVPLDLQMATLDFIKLVYKQDQDKKGFTFEGESGDKYPLASSFPPHIKRILDMYRIIM
jgi:hypothetical protein